MKTHEMIVNGQYWRVTRLSDASQFKIECHTKGVGWDTVMASAVVSEDDTLIHSNSMDEEVVRCCEDAIGAFLTHEETIYGFIPAFDCRSRIAEALELLYRYGGIDGGHHKQWCIDQAVRLITSDRYDDFVRWACDGCDGPNTYEWDEGIAP